MHYDVTKTSSPRNPWLVRNVTTGTLIGHHATRRAAMLCAAMLAGWRGRVTVEGK